MVHLGGAKLITQVADDIGVGVHFNPFVAWNERMVKYGVVRMHDLVQDILDWETFYLSGRLQKPVNRIVQGQFKLFQKIYKPFLDEYAAKELLRFSSSGDDQVNIAQDYGSSATRSLVSSLPRSVRSEMGMRLGEKRKLSESGKVTHEVVIGSREQTAECMRKVVRNKVMVSSARQAVSGLLAAGGVNGARYLAKKICKAWKSWV